MAYSKGNNLNLPQSQTQIPLYDLMANLLALTKRILSYLQKLSSLKSKYLETTQTGEQVKTLLERYKSQIENLPHQFIEKEQAKAWQRFSIRMLEIMTFHRHKYLEFGACKELTEMAKNAEDSIVGKNREKNINKALNNLLTIFARYLKKNSTIQIAEMEKSPRKLLKNTIDSECAAARLKLRTKNSSKQSTSLQKILTGFQKNLKELSCLDLQHDAYRNLFFHAKGIDREMLYEESMDANSHTMRQIRLYSKNFKEYFTRRQLKKTVVTRRNKFSDNYIKSRLKTIDLSTDSQKKKPQSPLQPKRQSQLINLNNFLITMDPHSNVQTFEQKWELTKQFKRKRTYQMKQLIISGSILSLGKVPKSTIQTKKCQTNKSNVIPPEIPTKHKSRDSRFPKEKETKSYSIFQVQPRTQ